MATKHEQFNTTRSIDALSELHQAREELRALRYNPCTLFRWDIAQHKIQCALCVVAEALEAERTERKIQMTLEGLSLPQNNFREVRS